MRKIRIAQSLKKYLGICALLAFCGVGRATTVLFVYPGSNNVSVGDTFTLNVDLLNDNPNVYGFDFEVTFPTFLSAISVTEQGFFGANGSGVSPTIDNGAGTISGIFDSASSPDPLSNPVPDTLVSIQFQALAPGSGSVAIECDNGNDCVDFPMLADNNFNSLPVDALLAATVTASPSSPVPEPSFIVPLGVILGFVPLRLRRRMRPE